MIWWTCAHSGKKLETVWSFGAPSTVCKNMMAHIGVSLACVHGRMSLVYHLQYVMIWRSRVTMCVRVCCRVPSVWRCWPTVDGILPLATGECTVSGKKWSRVILLATLIVHSKGMTPNPSCIMFFAEGGKNWPIVLSGGGGGEDTFLLCNCYVSRSSKQCEDYVAGVGDRCFGCYFISRSRRETTYAGIMSWGMQML